MEAAPSVPEYEAYRKRCGEELGRLRALRSAERARLEAWLQSTLAAVAADDHLLAAAIESEYLSGRQAIDRAFATAIDGFARSRLGEAAWRVGGSPAAPSAAEAPKLIFPAAAAYREYSAPPDAKRRRKRIGWCTRYLTEDGARAFDDLGIIILVYDTSNETVDEALRVGAKRWGAVRVLGSEAFVAKCLARAAVLGIDAADDQGRRRASPSNAPSRPPPPLEPSSPSPEPKPEPFVAAEAPLEQETSGPKADRKREILQALAKARRGRGGR